MAGETRPERGPMLAKKGKVTGVLGQSGSGQAREWIVPGVGGEERRFCKLTIGCCR